MAGLFAGIVFGEIVPADVYARVGRLEVTNCVLAALVLIQIGVKLALFTRVQQTSKRVEKASERMEVFLKLAERHGLLTDLTKDRTERAVASATQEVKREIAEVPNKTVEKLKELGSADSHPGIPQAGGT